MSSRAERISSASTSNAIELKGVERSFGALKALEDIDLIVRAGERRAVLGANGAGKNTLFNIITGDFPPSKGIVRFFGEDVTRQPTHQRIRKGMRRTYQSSLLFNGLTVHDNLVLAIRGVTTGRYGFRRLSEDDPASEAAERLAHAVHLDTIVHLPVGALGHGQQRQLELGLALAGAPRLMLLDEPAAGLAPTERRELIEILRALPPHIGYIIIEHDLDVALRVVESVTMMHNGRIFKHGRPEEIEADPEVQEIYLGGAHG
jgi:branched-chain amino acid transport system ATP-binding protein